MNIHEEFGAGNQPLSRAEIRARAQRRKYRRRRAGAILAIMVLMLCGVGVFSVLTIRGDIDNIFESSEDFEGEGHGEVVVEIVPGSSATQIANQLTEAGVVKSARAFLDEVEARNFVVSAGTYRLKSEMSAAAAVNALETGMQAHRVTVAEGHTIETIKKNAVTAGISQEAIDKAIDGKKPKDYGLEVDAPSLEGYLYPATYDLNADLDAEQLVQQMVNKTKNELNELAIPNDEANYYLTLASLVQVEANSDPDVQAKVARVFVNRVGKNSDTNGYLQSDATVAYLAGTRQDLTTTAEERDIDSPYNTYKYAGLPPGPINSPGEPAVRAAQNPAKGDWQYFVATNPDTGEVKFASNYSGHMKNVEEYRTWLREYRENNPDESAPAEPTEGTDG